MVDFAPHELEHLRAEHAHRRLGFSDAEIAAWFKAAGLAFVVAGARWGQADGQVMFIFVLALTAAEVAVALALVLLVGAGLMLRSLSRLLAARTGLELDHVGTLQVSFPRGPSAQRLAVIESALNRLEHVPAVAAAGVVNDLPLRGTGGIWIRVTPGGGTSLPASGLYARYLFASGGHFRAVGIPLIRGRLFTAADASVAPRLGILNDTPAHHVWPNRDAPGHQARPGARRGRETASPGVTTRATARPASPRTSAS